VNQTYLGINYHWVGGDWEIRSMCVDCELLEGSTVGEELALKVPKAYSKRQVTGVLQNCTDCDPTWKVRTSVSHGFTKKDRKTKEFPRIEGTIFKMW
jgi:hypothetical protein